MMGKGLPHFALALSAALILAGCGGGNDSSSGSGSNGGGATSASPVAQAQSQTAIDALAYFNQVRTSLGLQAVTRNAKLDSAAQAHSDYQAYSDVISHYETEGKQYFTGICLTDDPTDSHCSSTQTSRLEQAGYALPADNYAVGEVISETTSTSGANAASALLTAIYHRFVVLEPMFKEAGVGAATSATGETYFTADFGAVGLDSGLSFGDVVSYPSAGQTNVSASFSSDSEIPDPVPSKNMVGFPISVQADIIYTLNVTSFTVAPHGGSPLAVQNIWSGQPDSHASASEAAIIPLDPLQPATTYDVQFSGTMVLYGQNDTVINSTPVTRSWSFTTK